MPHFRVGERLLVCRFFDPVIIDYGECNAIK